MLDHIILNQFSYAFKTSEQQFAYKASISPTICSYLATETIQSYLNANSTVYAVSLDFSKAFDKVRYDYLFNTLLKRKICPMIIRLILNLYCTAK